MNQTRVARFRAQLAAAGLAGAVVRRPANVTYLTGYPARLDSPSFAVVSPERVALVAPGDAAATARRLDPALTGVGFGAPGLTLDRVPDLVEGSADALLTAIRELGLAGKAVGVELADVSARHLAAVQSAADVAPLEEWLAAARRIKDPDELRQIQEAVRANDVGFAAAASAIRAGRSELDVMNAVLEAMQRETGVPLDILDPTDALLSGPRTLQIAALATARRLEAGDLVLLDLNPFIGGYKGDTTRTFCVGEPTVEQRRAHEALVAGLVATETMARPGMTGGEIFALLVTPIVAAGFGTLQTHGGHSIGLEHTERPYIIPGETMPIEAGMVIALEPGLYLPGLGGIRCEDNFRVTPTGLQALSHYPRSLTVCG